MHIQQIHHVAYRCNDAKETIDWYRDKLDMKYLFAVSESKVPSTKEATPYMHLFLDAGNGNILAFFELPESPAMTFDPNTPQWVQHLAFQVKDEDTLKVAKSELEAKGVEVLGPTDHGFVRSIYFFDPNGHRLELCAPVATPEMMEKLVSVSEQMLVDWTKSKKALPHAAWVHEAELAKH
ncbi:VOC family protein [Rhodoferax sp.]|uniref:VOC family protein n=1 Tax=Rhodoferax sp. TaxID=50421 RepID=UPI00262DB731|nr:VOC family protein [Rhodoferax sp.]MDD2924329.1 VOC family protein [Rhodoferax sp.]